MSRGGNNLSFTPEAQRNDLNDDDLPGLSGGSIGIKGRDIYEHTFFFGDQNKTVVQNKDLSQKNYVCKLCYQINENCDRLKGRPATSYISFSSHAKSMHSNNWEQYVKQRLISSEPVGAIDKYFVAAASSRAYDIFNWLTLIVMKGRPFSDVECPLMRSLTKMGKVSVKTIMKYMELVVEQVRTTIQEQLPDKFGIVFDGWSDGHGGHLLAIFATFMRNDSVISLLLSIAPFLDEASFKASDHVKLLAATLLFYGPQLTIENTIQFITGDNCNTNKSFARKIKKPMVGCYSHRLNLASDLKFESQRGKL